MAFWSRKGKELERADPGISLDDWASYFTTGGMQYPLLGGSGSLAQKPEEIGSDWRGYVDGAYKSNGVVFAVMQVRMLLFSEARFQYQKMNKGRPGELWGDDTLSILEKPWPGGTTGKLLMRMIQDADLAGNFYARRTVMGGKPALERLRPDWVTIIMGTEKGAAKLGDLGVQVVGFEYRAGGRASKEKPVFLRVEDCVHYAPSPDPDSWFRGMSWLQPVVQEIIADKATTTHKVKFFEQGATANTVVVMDKDVQKDAFEAFKSSFEEQHAGYLNAYKTLFLGGGADVKVIGSNLQQLDLKSVQGHGETRIAAAGGVPPVIVGLSEGLEAATYSNYSQARRRLTDGTMRPLWREAAGALSRVLPVPGTSRLWYDDRDIPFLQEDMKDNAEISQMLAAAAKNLVESGFEPDTVRDALVAHDMGLLKHTGMYSVTLQKPTQMVPDPNADPGADPGVAPNPAALPAQPSLPAAPKPAGALPAPKQPAAKPAANGKP